MLQVRVREDASGGLEIYDEALAAGADRLQARWSDGTTLDLPLKRWLGAPAHGDESVLRRATGPALDIGCGPGRHLVALGQRGVEALGVDVSRAAVEIARRRGARAITGSIFDRLPGDRRWGTALLLDGNIGIGGAPRTLLRRVLPLLAPRGQVLVELDAPGVGSVDGVVRLAGATGWSDPFRWARVGVDDVDALAAATGYSVAEVWSTHGRWFGALRPARTAR